MATFTLQTRGREVVDPTRLTVDIGKVFVHTGAQADTLNLPLNVPAGSSFDILNNSTFAITVAPQSGETLAGDNVIGEANARVTYVKVSATGWKGALNSAAPV